MHAAGAVRARARWIHVFRRHCVALGILAAALALGFIAADDYGLAFDQETQYQVGQHTVDFVLGENTDLLTRADWRYYGAAFEVVLLAFERVLGLTDTRSIFLSRYLLSHAFFLVGAFACYLLAHRLFKSRALALFAMLLLLCHPRMYGQSFFNSKDMPFLSMFLIALLMAHGALRRAGRVGAAGDVGAFAGLGAWLGLAGTIRPMAFLLVALLPLVRCADFPCAGRRERVRMLACSGALALASTAAFVGGLPYLWGDPPARFAEWFGLMSDHPTVVESLFLGEWISTDQRPLAYIPVWFSVTTPVFATLLALLGGVALCARLAARPRQALADASVRFGLLLASCVLTTVVVVTFWVGNIYNGWRHLYFLYGPICLGAAGGLAWLCRSAGDRLAALARLMAALGLASTLAWVVRLHPHENVYFNFLVDRRTPERLSTQFDIDYWRVRFKEGLRLLLDAHRGEIAVGKFLWRNVALLRPEQRRRVGRPSDFSAFFYMPQPERSYVSPVHMRKVYSNTNTLYALARLEVDGDDESRYRADQRAALATAPRTPAGGVPPFDVHWNPPTLTYLRRDCEAGDVANRMFRHREKPAAVAGGRRLGPHGDFFLHVFGDREDAADLSGRYKHNEGFRFRHRGVVLREEGESRTCMARVDLRDYKVDAMRTGQMDARGNWLWHVVVVPRASLRRALARVRATAPVARGGFDVHLDDGALAYVKEGCVAADQARFFLHVVPFDFAAVPPSAARRGFVNRDFSFATHGAVLDGVCVARVRLPPFRVRSVSTGQFDAAEGQTWRVEIVLSGGSDQPSHGLQGGD